MFQKKVPRINKSIRFRKDLDDIGREICKKSIFTFADLLELGFIELVLLFKDNMVYDGIDIKQVVECIKAEKLLGLRKIERKHLKNSDLFIDRVKRDVVFYIIKKKTKAQILRLLEAYKKEAEGFINKAETTKEIDDLIAKANETSYLADLKNVLMNEQKAIDYIK